jgi:hypothetical protein
MEEMELFNLYCRLRYYARELLAGPAGTPAGRASL